MGLPEVLTRIAAELALFAGAGFLLFAVNDLLVDLIYFGRPIWRAATVYSRYPRAFASEMPVQSEPGFMAVLVPAWDESGVIASMLRAALDRFDYPNYAIFVGYYRNDPATGAAIASISDSRIEAVQIEADGPTTKADCLNHIYDALVAFETMTGRCAKAVVLHDAEDVAHPLELRLFDRLIDRAAVIQLPVLPLVDGSSRWVSGHYCDEFAEAHIKELVVREAVGASIPLAGVGCAIARTPLAKLAAGQEGKPFAGTSMTEDYEVGLRLGALGLKTIFVRTLVRGRQGAPLGTPSLASGGTLGGSQAGARLTYNFTRQIGATLRTTRRSAAAAAKSRSARASSRSSACRCGSRSNGASGWGGLAAADAVELRARCVSPGRRCRLSPPRSVLDGGATFTRPIYRNFSGGVGVWGAGQRGVYRIDAGPRVSMKVRNNVRVHFDWRQKLAGKAQPGSGPAVTLAGDF